MRQNKTIFMLAVVAAFAAGLAASPLAQHVIADAHAQPAGLAPTMIDLAALTHAALPTTANREMNAKLLVSTDGATIGIQSGNVAKHVHAKTDEIQYIIEGSGAMWLGGERREFKPGTLIIIPRGTPHAGTIVSSGPVKAIAIKIPPQAKDDIAFVD
jgi:mannose-6-phosphate isomerase-like protein (cupin superfamily)